MPRRKASELGRDRRRVAEMYLRGSLQADIAAELGIDQSTVSRDLKSLQCEWLASALVDINEAKSRELARVDELERTYWAAWERSQEPIEVTSKRATQNEAGKRFDVNTQSRGQVGDPRFLAGVGWCIERRCRVLGLDAPTRQELTGAEGGPMRSEVVVTWDNVIEVDEDGAA